MNLKSLLTGLATTLILFSVTAQDTCTPFFPIKKGTAWEYTELDKNGEASGSSKTIVENIEVVDTKVVYSLKGISDGPKKKEKNHHETSFQYTCDNGVLKMSMENMIPQETMQGMEDMEMEITQNEMIFPAQMNVGDKLDDATITMKISSSGMTVMNMTVTITDRIVEKTESITTDSGTYECVVVSYNTLTDMGIMKREGSGREWFSPAVGLVKSESYDKKGGLEYSRILKAYTAGS